jgi:magnesium transporter
VAEVLTGLGSDERARVAALRVQGGFFWLDVSLTETSRDQVAQALTLPHGALRALASSGDTDPARRFVVADEDSVAFPLRCYVEAQAEEEAVYRERPLEVHVVVTSDYVLTVHTEPLSLPALLEPGVLKERSRRYVVYSVLDAMLESTFGALAEVDGRLEALAATWAAGGGGVPRTTLKATGARLANMRRWVTAEQAIVERAAVEIGGLEGFDAGDESYFDRLDAKVDRLATSIDAAADAMGMLLDLQLNERAYLVSVVATIFVPLTLVTGFFGMNFGWMVDHVDGPLAFWLLGMVIPIAAAALSWHFLVRRFLVGDDTSAERR